MLIDVRTAYVVVGVLYLILPMTVWVLLKDYKQKSVTLWCAGGMLVGLGTAVLGLRPLLVQHLPGFITYTVFNAIVLVGYLSRVQSLRLDLKKPVPFKWLVMWVVLFVSIYEPARIGASDGFRIAIAYWFYSGVGFWLTSAAYEYERFFAIGQMRVIWLVYLIFSIVLCLRATLLALGLESADPFHNSILNLLLATLGMLTAVYSNLAYLGIMLAQAEKRNVASTKKNAELVSVLDKQAKVIRDLMRVQAFSVVGTYGSTVVHEILQPLTAMRFALENLKACPKLSEDKTTQARIVAVDSSAARAIAVIENLRNFIVEREVQIAPVRLDNIMREVLAITASRAKVLDVQVTLKINDDILVMADAHQLQRVVFNIVNNALDAIERNPESVIKQVLINTKYVQQKQFVLIKIIDSGVGLYATDQAEIFEWLSTSSNKGMGIGLALSKMLVESWRGNISAYNADPKVDGLSGAVIELKLQSA